VRTALRRARRLGAFLLVVLAAGWVLLRRRSPVRWIEPGPALEPGAPGELPADVLATDAGLTELPSGDESGPAPAGTVVVDEALVAELLAVDPNPGPDVPGNDELVDAEPGVAGPEVSEAAAAGAVAEVVAAEPVEAVVAEEPGPDDEPTETELVAPELGIDEPTMTIAREAIASEDEESSTRIPMPTFSEAPTMEIPAVTDDLRAVRGIGPSMERLLHGLGIISFRQLAMLDGVELERVRAELSDFRTRIERENWVGQARDLHKEKYGREPG
jgi:predicted flap endonuclease-1-like 5' DNA nuclease